MTPMTSDTATSGSQGHASSRAARDAFAGEGLPWPPVPEPLASALQPVADTAEGVFATRTLPIGPYALEAYVGEALAGKAPGDYALVGFDGHGMNSRAAHFYLVRGPLALFVQVPWGGAFAEAEAERTEVTQAFDWSGRLLARVTELQSTGRWPANRRLFVVETRLGHRRWGWASARPSAMPVLWRQGQDMEAAIDGALDALPGA